MAGYLSRKAPPSLLDGHIAAADSRRRWSLVQVGLCGYYLVFVGWFFLSGDSGGYRTFIADGAYLPLGVSAIVLALWAARRSGRGRDRTVWLLLGLALLFREQGDGMWWWLEAVQGESPFPSVADIGYSGFYPVLILALVLMPVRRQSRQASVANLLDVLAMVGGAFMLIWYLVLGAAVEAGFGDLEHLLNISYPLWDLMLLLVAGRVVLRGSDPQWTVATRWLIAGACSFVVADVGFGYLSAQDGFTGGGWLDLFWVGALLCFALAAASRPGVAAAAADSGRYAHLLPVLAIVASYAVVAQVAVGLPMYPLGGVLIADLLITVVVVVRQLVTVSEQRALAVGYRAAAVTDTLTGLPNRALIMDRLEQLLARVRREGGHAAALFIDLDGFKDVNDEHGHEAGDRLLQAVASRLTSTLREVDTFGRLGGDEFIVVLDFTTRPSAPELVAQRILDVLAQPFEITDGTPPVTVTASIGVAVSAAASATELLRSADVALYQAKRAGRNCFVLFQPEMSTEPTAGEELTTQLAAAVSGHQFHLVYQPIYDLGHLTMVGVEALIRWHHPTRGEVLPGEFIPALERSGQIIEVGRWVLLEACTQMAQWHRAGHELSVSVNVSARQLDHDSVIEDVRDALRVSGLAPTALTLEVTETAILRDLDAVSSRLRELKTLEVRIALDDFGTGYSSLAYLQHFPIDTLKIDRSFIEAIGHSRDADAIIRTLVQLGKDLGLTTVAEGVESTEQLDHVREHGITDVQGFLLARPLDPTTFEDHFLRTGAAVPQPVAP